MRHHGIERQVLLVALIPILMMAFLLENYLIYARFSDLDSAMLERAEMTAGQLASSSEYPVFTDEQTLLQEAVRTILVEKDVSRVKVMDRNGKTILDTAQPQVTTTMFRVNDSLPIYQNDDELEIYKPIIATQIKINGNEFESPSSSVRNKPLGAIAIEFSKSRLIRQKHDILLFSVSISLLIFIVTMMLALWVARLVTKPIIGMSHAIRNIGSGNLDARISPLPKVFELHDLAAGINRMSQQIKHERAVLESRIAERTAALAASEAESRTLLENSPDTIARYDLACRCIYVNSIPEILNPDGIRTHTNSVHTGQFFALDSEELNDKVRSVLASGQNTQFELKYVGVNGQDCCTHIRLTAERNTYGKVVSVLAVGRDITELNNSRTELGQIADALRYNEQLLLESQLIAGLGSYIFDISTSTWESSTVLDNLFGVNDDYPRTVDSWVELVHPEDRLMVSKFLSEEVLGRGNLFDQVYRIIRLSDGAELWVHGLGKLEFDREGKPARLLGTVQNISEQKKSEQLRTESIRLLKEKELAKSRFLAAAGHDLRQPLTAANLFIDALKFTNISSEQSRIIQHLDQSMATFNDLLDALLNISKLDAGVIKPEYELIDIADVFRWLEQGFAMNANDKQLAFKLFFPMSRKLTVRSDQGLLNSVLMNLVGNAIKYTHTGGILIAARRRGINIVFQVWDTGIGIKTDHMEHIFEEFYQVDNQQRDRSLGLGLGLAIVKRALNLLGAEIRFRSRVNHGSVFEFSLPLYFPERTIPPLHTKPATLDELDREKFVRGKCFVIVEDDTLVAEAMTNALDIMGAEVSCFNNAESAMADNRVGEADYYIMDYMLGSSLNGIQFLDQLWLNTGRRPNAVLVTGDTSPDFVRSVVDCEWPVLHKPVNISKIIRSLNDRA